MIWLWPLKSGVEFSTSDALSVLRKFQILGLGTGILMHLSKVVYFPSCSFLAPFLLSASPLDLLACFLSIIIFLIHIFHIVQTLSSSSSLFWVGDLTVLPMLGSNLWSAASASWVAGIISVCHHAWQHLNILTLYWSIHKLVLYGLHCGLFY